MIVISVGGPLNVALVQSNGRAYSCPLHEIDGELKFKFKGEWHRVEDYTYENTFYH